MSLSDIRDDAVLGFSAQQGEAVKWQCAIGFIFFSVFVCGGQWYMHV